MRLKQLLGIFCGQRERHGRRNTVSQPGGVLVKKPGQTLLHQELERRRVLQDFCCRGSDGFQHRDHGSARYAKTMKLTHRIALWWIFLTRYSRGARANSSEQQRREVVRVARYSGENNGAWLWNGANARFPDCA